MDEASFERQKDFARMAFANPTGDVERDRKFFSQVSLTPRWDPTLRVTPPAETSARFFSQSHATACGKMTALKNLLRKWKAAKSKVLLFTYSTQVQRPDSNSRSRKETPCLPASHPHELDSHR